MAGPAQRAGRSRPREAMPRTQRPLTLPKLGVRDRTRAVLKAFELQLVLGEIRRNRPRSGVPPALRRGAAVLRAEVARGAAFELQLV